LLKLVLNFGEGVNGGAVVGGAALHPQDAAVFNAPLEWHGQIPT